MPNVVQQTLTRAVQYLNTGNLAQVETLAQQILAHDPHNPDALNLLSIVATQCNYHKEAVDFLLRAIAINPNNPEYHSNLGNVYTQLAQYDLAEKSLRHALTLEPDCPNTYTALGCIFDRQLLFAQAQELHRRALALDPNFFHAHNNLGLSLHRQGNFSAAIEHYEKAIASAPNFADAHWNLALVLLLTGNLARGWQEWEWRWKYKALPSPVRNFPQPLWTGQDLKNKTIFLHAEQGFGDAIQCARYIPLVAARGPKKILVECHPELLTLFHRIPGITQIFPRFDPQSQKQKIDFQAPFMSLPLAFNTTLETIPNTVPYLTAPENLITHFQTLLEEHFSSSPGTRIGLVWQGSTTHRDDHTRSIPLSALAPLFQIPHLQFISLQLAPAAADITKSQLPLLDLSPHLKDFAHTAALITHLDLIITVDTAVAHLTGSLAKPTWLLLPQTPDWRWLLDRDDSPWYPTLKLFRQPASNSWPPVIEQLTTELRNLKPK